MLFMRGVLVALAFFSSFVGFANAEDKTCKETQDEIYHDMARNSQRIKEDRIERSNLAKRLNRLRGGCPKEALEIEKRLRTHYNVKFETYRKNKHTGEPITVETADRRGRTLNKELQKYRQKSKAQQHP